MKCYIVNGICDFIYFARVLRETAFVNLYNVAFESRDFTYLLPTWWHVYHPLYCPHLLINDRDPLPFTGVETKTSHSDTSRVREWLCSDYHY